MKPYQLLVLLFLTVFGTQVFAGKDTLLPPNFSLETVASGLGQATGFAFAADERIFVTTKDGVVQVVQYGELLSSPFIDLSDSVNDAGDRGLTDVAVHPEFPKKPYIYVAYVYDPPEISGLSGLAAPDARGRRVSRVTRFTADSKANFNKVVPGSGLSIVGKNSTFSNMGTADKNRDQGDIACMQGDSFIADCMPADDYSHLVGSLQFADDGSLYVSNGDGSSVAPYAIPMTLRALDIDSMAGKILRVNPDTGQGYADNPFYDGNLNSNRSKVINYGLRNPYDFTVDKDSGSVVMGDTGWESWEEINSGRGKNFGWPCYEGGDGWSSVQPAYASVCRDYLQEGHTPTASTFAYEHLQSGGAVTGVEVYKGTQYPEQYQDAIFFSDFVREEVSYVTLLNGEFYSVLTFASDIAGVSKIRRGANDDLYFLNLFEGSLSRLAYADEVKQTPTAKIVADPIFGDLPLLVNFDALSSLDPLGGGLSYHWDFGDGQESQLASAQHTYFQQGAYLATLRVSSASGGEDTTSIVIQAGTTAPEIQILDALDDRAYVSGEEVVFEARVSSAEADFDVSQANVEWSAYFDEDGKQSIPLQMHDLLRGRFSFPELHSSQHVTLCLQVTTLDDIESQECVVLSPLLASVLLDTKPSGLSLSINGQKFKTPHEEFVHVGTRAIINADVNKGVSFTSWSNGLPEQQEFIVTQEGLVLTASYQTEGGLGSLGVVLAFLLLNVFVRRENSSKYG